MAFIQKIYQKSPLFIQNFMISIFGLLWQNRRFGGVYKKELEGFQNRQFWSKNQFVDYQTLQLRNLLIHAEENVPYYKSLFSSLGITRKMLESFSLEDLPKIAPLEKNQLREFGESTLLSTKREPKGKFFSSSGSTGTPTKILMSHAAHQKWSAAFECRIRNWAGVNRKTPRGMIGGRRIILDPNSKGPFHRYNFTEKQIYFSAYHISPKNAEKYAEALKKRPVDYMTGYAVSNFTLAKYLLDQKIVVPPLKAVITSSEKLTSEMRSIFQQVYGCKTYDSYSGVEACGLISENEFGQLLISPDVGIMEILKEDGTPCLPGEIGEIYSTGFLNYDQPLIRYRIGDMVKLAKDQTNKCGRNMVVVEEIIGRVEDTVIGADGRQMVRFHGVFIDLPKIIEGQIIQHTLTNFEIKIVVTSKLTSLENDTILQRMVSQLGSIQLEINEVDTIPRNANGKFKAVVSHLKK